MRNVTREALSRLAASDLFGAVGQPAFDDRVIQVASWRDATKSHSSQFWEYLEYELSNKLTIELHDNHPERYSGWNEIVDECRPTVDACVERGLAKLTDVPDVKDVYNNATWNILGAIMEIEYSDVVPVGFFCGIFDWHCRGHYPCGQLDPYPEGRLVLY